MAVEVEIVGRDSAEISKIVHELKMRGYRTGVDFDFAYSPGKWTPETGTVDKKTVFTFYMESLSVWFVLNYV